MSWAGASARCQHAHGRLQQTHTQQFKRTHAGVGASYSPAFGQHTSSDGPIEAGICQALGTDKRRNGFVRQKERPCGEFRRRTLRPTTLPNSPRLHQRQAREGPSQVRLHLPRAKRGRKGPGRRPLPGPALSTRGLPNELRLLFQSGPT